MNTMDRIKQNLKTPPQNYDIIGKLIVVNFEHTFNAICEFLFDQIVLMSTYHRKARGFMFFDLTEYHYFKIIRNMSIYDYHWRPYDSQYECCVFSSDSKVTDAHDKLRKYQEYATSPLVCCLAANDYLCSNSSSFSNYDTYCSRDFDNLYDNGKGPISVCSMEPINAKMFSTNKNVYLQPYCYNGLIPKATNNDCLKWYIQLNENEAQMICELLHQKFLIEGFRHFNIEIFNAFEKVGEVEKIVTKKFLQKPITNFRFVPEYEKSFDSKIVYFDAAW